MNAGNVVAIGAFSGFVVWLGFEVSKEAIDRSAWLVGRLQRAWEDSYVHLLLDERDQHRRVISCRRREIERQELDPMVAVEERLAQDIARIRASADRARQDIEAFEEEELEREFGDTYPQVRELRFFNRDDWDWIAA